MRLKGKVSLITGSASGIGKASAILFAKEGSRVVVSDIQKREGEDVVRFIREGGGEAVFVQADVTKAAEVAIIKQKIVVKEAIIKLFFIQVRKGFSNSMMR